MRQFLWPLCVEVEHHILAHPVRVHVHLLGDISRGNVVEAQQRYHLGGGLAKQRRKSHLAALTDKVACHWAQDILEEQRVAQPWHVVVVVHDELWCTLAQLLLSSSPLCRAVPCLPVLPGPVAFPRGPHGLCVGAVCRWVALGLRNFERPHVGVRPALRFCVCAEMTVHCCPTGLGNMQEPHDTALHWRFCVLIRLRQARPVARQPLLLSWNRGLSLGLHSSRRLQLQLGAPARRRSL